MEQLKYTEAQKEAKRKRLDRVESQYLRARRIRLTKETFTTIQVIGRGSFGEVRSPKFGKVARGQFRVLLPPLMGTDVVYF